MQQACYETLENMSLLIISSVVWMQGHTHIHTHTSSGDWFHSLLYVRVHANVANCSGQECVSARACNVCVVGMHTNLLNRWLFTTRVWLSCSEELSYLSMSHVGVRGHICKYNKFSTFLSSDRNLLKKQFFLQTDICIVYCQVEFLFIFNRVFTYLNLQLTQ